MVMATTDDANYADDYMVTAAATAAGGGTVNLSLKRRIRDSATDVSRSDGPIYIWIVGSRNAVTTGEDLYANIICEAWGRFIKLELV